MAAREARKGKPDTGPGSVAPDRLRRVGRAARPEPAGWPASRRQRYLVEADEPKECPGNALRDETARFHSAMSCWRRRPAAWRIARLGTRLTSASTAMISLVVAGRRGPASRSAARRIRFARDRTVALPARLPTASASVQPGPGHGSSHPSRGDALARAITFPRHRALLERVTGARP